MSDLLIATHTAVMWHDGRRIKITKGKTVVKSNDPIVKGREKLFRPLQARQFGHIEDASAEPGELRETTPRRGRKKAELAASENVTEQTNSEG